MFIMCSTDLDLEPGLLAHLALQRRAMILARIGPPARQIPFIAFIQKQENAAVVDDDPLHRERMIAHRSAAVP